MIYIRKQSQTRPVCSGEIQKEPFLLPVTYSLEKEREEKKKEKSDEVAHDKIYKTDYVHKAPKYSSAVYTNYAIKDNLRDTYKYTVGDDA